MEVKNFSVFVDSDGIIQRVLKEAVPVFSLPKGMPFSIQFGSENQIKIQKFLKAIRTDRHPVGIRLCLVQDETEYQIYLTGLLVAEECLITGLTTISQSPDPYFIDLIKINNEQMNTLRSMVKALLKTKQKPTDQETLNGLTEVNNQLMALQRKVNQQNAKLDRQLTQIGLLNQMNTELQLSDSLEQTLEIVVQYVKDLFPGSDGTLYLYRADIERFENQTSWGEDRPELGVVDEINQADFIEELKRLDEMQEIQRRVEGSFPKDCLFLAVPGYDWIVGMLQILPNRRNKNGDAFRDQYQGAFLQSIGLAISNMQMRERLRSDASIDPLTGLYNRRFLDHQLVREISRAIRQRSVLSVVMIDLDGFKTINDVHGHQVGDRWLAVFGELLQNSIRKEDYACRYGGDEFTLILPDALQEESMTVIERVKQGLWQATSENPEIALHFSYGLATYPEHGENANQVVKMADHFLFEMKKKKSRPL